ncbi:MAG: phosphoenolpyruvate--protein phosphotransferase [Geminicoccaceae bacterium]
MTEEHVIQGISASGGIARGVLTGPRARVPAPTTGAGDAVLPADQAVGAIRKAIADTLERLRELAGQVEAEAAEILEFQMAFLDDDSLIEEVMTATGDSPASPLAMWHQVMEAQIEPFANEEDAYFRARAADLRDMAQSVADALGGRGEGDQTGLRDDAILLDVDLAPSRFLALDRTKVKGIALREGSVTSHVAMLARSRGLPMAVRLGDGFEPGCKAVLDGNSGRLVLDPSTATLAALARSQDRYVVSEEIFHGPAMTSDGRRIEVHINIDDPSAIGDATWRACDGVGLCRTELLFDADGGLPDEETQYRLYRSVLERLDGKPAIIRTLDVGGDKPIRALGQPHETNPFLGLRGIRLCLERPAIFAVQLRALLRAAVHGDLRIMLPMVSVQEEIDRTNALIEDLLQKLNDAGIEARRPPLGVMIETPAAALVTDRLRADFMSIGSNDLTQYVLAASRDASGAVARLLDPRHPAVLRLIGEVADSGRARGLEVSLCGDMASDPAMLRSLLAAGLGKISVAPAMLGPVKQAIATFEE